MVAAAAAAAAFAAAVGTVASLGSLGLSEKEHNQQSTTKDANRERRQGGGRGQIEEIKNNWMASQRQAQVLCCARN